MALVVPNVGEVAFLNAILGVAGKCTPPFSLKLFSNNVTPGSGNVIGNFTEVTGGGYAAIALAASGFTVVGGTPSYMAYALQAFVFSGATNAPGTVYGYIIVDANNVVCTVELVPGAPGTPFVPSATNGIIIQPLLTMASVNSD